MEIENLVYFFLLYGNLADLTIFFYFYLIESKYLKPHSNQINKYIFILTIFWSSILNQNAKKK